MAGLIRCGSSKDVSTVDGAPNQLDFIFSNRVSVFDIGPIPVEFPGLGQLRCAIAGRIFEFLRENRITTHYVSHDVGSATMRVNAVDVPEKGLSFPASIGRMLPAEILFRYQVTKGVYDRIKSGKLDRTRFEQLLVPGQQITPGTMLETAFVECSTKWKDADTYISDEEAVELLEIERQALSGIYQHCVGIASLLRCFFGSVGLTLCDGKFEIAWPFCLIDSISPDELRLVDANGLSYDKDLVRAWYKQDQSKWFDILSEAKREHPNNKSMWPTYEAVPPKSVIEELVHRYRVVAEGIDAI